MRAILVALFVLVGGCSRGNNATASGERTVGIATATAADARSAVPPTKMATATARATLTFEGMLCQGCARAAERALANVPGVSVARVDFEHRSATVEFDPRRTNADALVGALEHLDRSPSPPFRVTRREVER